MAETSHEECVSKARDVDILSRTRFFIADDERMNRTARILVALFLLGKYINAAGAGKG